MLYFFEGHNNVLANSGIDDTIQATDPVNIDGSFVVRVPNGVQLEDDPPATLADLVTQKHQGLLALYPGFANIVYDDCTDASGFTLASQTGVTLGSRGTISILGVGTAETDMVTLAATPNDCIVYWEVFNIVESNPAMNGRFTRSYDEVDPTDFTVRVSFDNGANFSVVTEGTLFTISPPIQGNQLIVQFINASGSRRWLGSWAVIY